LYFNGSIDEVRVFARALSADEIRASYNSSEYRLQSNFTGLDYGSYSFRAYTQDSNGVSSTELRTMFRSELIDHCQVLSDSNKAYSLNNDIIDYDGTTCFNITGTNITLDCEGYRVDNTFSSLLKLTYGIEIRRSANEKVDIRIRNCNLSNWHYGIFLYDINSTKIINSSFYSNAYGVFQIGSSNVSVINCSFSGNKYRDYHVYGSEDYQCDNYVENSFGESGYPIGYYNYSVSLQNKIFSELILCDADNSNLNNITIIGSNNSNHKINTLLMVLTDNTNLSFINSSNNNNGLFMARSTNNIITNSSFNNNKNSGITVYYGGDNVISHNQIKSNYIGFYTYLMGSSGANLIYDNYINNSINYYIPDSVSHLVYDNYWSITQYSGTNILGGSLVGGNVWADPYGFGFSEVCVDSDFDGFCDNTYELDDNNDSASNEDYLPLALDSVIPFIVFDEPTPNNNSYHNGHSIIVNVTVIDDSRTMSFIDWDSSLLLWYPFNNLSNPLSSLFLDSSPHDNDGSCNSEHCPAINYQGSSGRAIHFNGTDQYVEIPYSPIFNLSGTDEVTISAWVKIHSLLFYPWREY